MLSVVRETASRLYERVLESELSGTPDHVAVIQDGNRRYAREQGQETTHGHRAGAETTKEVLRWCKQLGIEELTLYAFSTENFNRPEEQRETIFDIIEDKLREFADSDSVHEEGVRIRVIGEREMLPERVREASRYAERRTADYDNYYLNVALAYGGRTELLNAAQQVTRAVERGDLDPEDIDVDTVESELYGGASREVDLIIRTGGDERTSNFLPWQANGNEAAVYFCTPYWPEFSRIDFLRGIRTYQSREASWRRTRAKRALALVRAIQDAELKDARQILSRMRDSLSDPDGIDLEATDEDPEPKPN